MSKYWNEVASNEARSAYESGSVVQFKVKKDFKKIKAHWNPCDNSHRFSDTYQYRVLVND